MKFFRFLLTTAVLSLPAVCLRAELIPASRLTSWTPGVSVGVTGGIPTNRNTLIDVTKSPYNADKTGANDCTSAISSAIDAAVAFNDGHVVYLPAGTYKMTGGITKSGKNNFTIRGAGDTTVINASGSANTFVLGWSTDWGGGVAITNGLTAGSTVLTLANVTGLTVGQQLRIDEQLDLTRPILDTNHDLSTWRVHAQTVRITNVNTGANQVTISRGLLWTLQSGLSPQAHPMAYNVVATGIGIEDLKIDSVGSTASFTIWLEDVTQSWVKNVHFVNSYNYELYVLACSNFEVRHCYFDHLNGSGPSHSHLIVEQTSDSLIEDNIFYQASTHFMLNYGCSGNVFAANFMEDTTIGGGFGQSININHGAHNSYNLIEGNISCMVEDDGYFGGSSEQTIYRNWLHGVSPGATRGGLDSEPPLHMKRFGRNHNIVGNILGMTGKQYKAFDSTSPYSSYYILGYPNIGNDEYSGTASLINSAPWADWAAYVAGTYTGGTGGFQEIDLDVAATATIKGNYNYKDAQIPASETLSGQTLANSLYRTSKPAFFGSLTWPAFDPTNVGTPSYDQIPAGYRYVHGIEPPGVGTTQPPANARTEIQAR